MFEPDGLTRSDQTARILAALLAASDDAIIAHDLDGVITGWNRTAERLYGYAAEEVLGCSVALLSPVDRWDELRTVLEYVRLGRAIDRYVTVHRLKGGHTVQVSVTVAPVTGPTGRVVSAVMMARDATVLARAQLAYEASEARWRAVIDAAVDGIIVIDARGMIEAFNPAAERLFGYAAREITGQSVNRLMSKPDSDEHDHHVARYLLTNMLLFAQLPPLRLQVVEVAHLIEMTAALARDDLSFQQLRIDVSGSGLPIVADAELLKIALWNLFVNSAQAMGGRGVIGVSVESTAVGHRILVSDEGPGIPPDVRERLFTPFFTTKTRAGGLGLLIARRIVEAHQGWISVECPPHGGTLVTIQLPARRVDHSRAAKAAGGRCL